MLESIHIQGFKGFRDTQIGPLRKVNLVVGGQNVGKTSLLEAVNSQVAAGSYSSFRSNEGNDQMRFSNNAFGQKFKSINLHLLKNQEPHVVAIPLFLPGQLNLVQLFGKIVLARKKQKLTDMLREVEPRLLSLDAIAPDGEQRIYAEIEGIDQALPLPELGHGFARLLYLFSTLLSTGATLALIDEVENGIHYGALPVLMQGIKNVAKERNVQTIMTTHSWDCIRAACEVFEDSPDDFQVIRLERTEDNIRAVCIGGEQMLRMMNNDMEVR